MDDNWNKEPDNDEDFRGFQEENQEEVLAEFYRQLDLGFLEDDSEDEVSAVPNMARSLIGTLIPFTPKEETFSDFKSRFEEFCDLNEDLFGEDPTTQTRKKKLLFLNHLPIEVRSTLSRLAQPSEPKDKTLDALKDLLQNHYNPPTLALNAVRKFQKLAQGPTETVTDFILKLKSISKDCNFGDDLDRNLHTQLCLGLKSDRAVDQIAQKGVHNTTTNSFDAACAQALQKETLETQRLERKNDREALAQVNKMARGKFKKQLQQPSSSNVNNSNPNNNNRGNTRGNWNQRGDYTYTTRGRGNSRGRGRGMNNNTSNMPQNNTGFNRGGYNHNRGNHRGSFTRSQGPNCWRCGRSGCNPESCWAKTSQCYECGQFGHAKYFHRRPVNSVQSNNSNYGGNSSNHQEDYSEEQEATNFVNQFDSNAVAINKINFKQGDCYVDISGNDQEAYENMTKEYEEEYSKFSQEGKEESQDLEKRTTQQEETSVQEEKAVQEESADQEEKVVQEESSVQEERAVQEERTVQEELPQEEFQEKMLIQFKSTEELLEYIQKKKEKKSSPEVGDAVFQALQEGKEVHFVQINSVLKHAAHMVDVKINNQKIAMEADTGSGVTLLPEKLFKREFPTVSLQKTNLFLTTLSAPLRVVGTVEVLVPDAEGKVHKLRVVICQASFAFCPLLGRDWMDILMPQWREALIMTQKPGVVQAVEDLPVEIQKLVERFPEVFSEDRSNAIKGFQAGIIMKENPKLICHKEYDLPYSVIAAVSDQLRQEVQEGLMIPVEKAEAGRSRHSLSPMVDSQGEWEIQIVRGLQEDTEPQFENRLLSTTQAGRFI